MADVYHPVTLIDLSWPRPHTDGNHGEGQPDGDASCSGLILDNKHGFILSHASILGPYLADYPEECARIKTTAYTTTPSEWPVCVNVLTQKHNDHLTNKTPGYLSKPNQNTHNFNRRYYTELLNCTQARLEQQCDLQLISKNPARIYSIFKLESFAKSVERLLPKAEGWKTVDDTPDSELKKPASNEDLSFLLPYFVVIKLDKPGRFIRYNIHRGRVNIGDHVTVIGTPFATLSPEIFMNSYSQGVISNAAGFGQSLLLTDARCIPGSEGGALCLTGNRNSRMTVAGIVVAPLCWKQNEWIGLSICCSMSEIMDTLMNVTKLSVPKSTLSSKISGNGNICGQNVCLVECNASWGTGLVLDWNEGLVLTCSHVVKGNTEVKVGVRVDYPSRKWYRASVVYAAPSRQVFDVALLKFTSHLPNNNMPVRNVEINANPQLGDKVTVIGHALFSADKKLLPSQSSGTLCKIVRHEGVPVMLQTSCLVHCGASGGPVLSEDGAVVAMVTCNAKDNESKASFPHVNLAVPMVTIWPFLQEYIKTKDAEVLKGLHVQNNQIQQVWTLSGSDQAAGGTSKL